MLVGILLVVVFGYSLGLFIKELIENAKEISQD